jgi:FkbM family methyltransferase
MKFYSQYGQDKWLYSNYFKDKLDGTFLEIGADDGVDKSNTKFFEELGWVGMCVEPSPKRFKLLKQNRSCVCENYAISDKICEVEFMDISGWGKGLSGIVDYYSKEHKKRIENEIKHPLNGGSEIIKVKTELLSNLLDKHNLKKIDFCTIDTEGGEFEILKTIDFDKYDIKIILIENNYNETKIKEFLKNKDYTIVTRIGVDDVYIKNNN